MVRAIPRGAEPIIVNPPVGPDNPGPLGFGMPEATATPVPIAYTVTAALPDEQTARRFVDWLAGGHVQAVIEGGADAADIVEVAPSEGQKGRTVEVRYRFPTQQALERYDRELAPALRAEGREKFGPDTGVTMSRSVGTIRSITKQDAVGREDGAP